MTVRADADGARAFRPAARAALNGCAAAALATLSIACAPKTKYVAPTVEVAPALRENANWKMPEPRDAEIRGRWWELFDDSQLTDLEARVEISNQSIRASEAQFAQARALVHGARANLGPQIALTPSIAAVQPSG